jgi:hypothetical protein
MKYGALSIGPFAIYQGRRRAQTHSLSSTCGLLLSLLRHLWPDVNSSNVLRILWHKASSYRLGRSIEGLIDQQHYR